VLEDQRAVRLIVHNSRKPDREGRSATELALDRDVAPHHLAEALADREPKAYATVTKPLNRQMVHWVSTLLISRISVAKFQGHTNS